MINCRAYVLKGIFSWQTRSPGKHSEILLLGAGTSYFTTVKFLLSDAVLIPWGLTWVQMIMFSDSILQCSSFNVQIA